MPDNVIDAENVAVNKQNKTNLCSWNLHSSIHSRIFITGLLFIRQFISIMVINISYCMVLFKP